MPGGDGRSGAKILEAPYIVTMDSQRRVLKGAALLVEGNTISAVGLRDEIQSRAPDAERLLFDRHAILPGFIDCHEHATQMLGRGLADDVAEVTVRWGWDRIYPWEAVLEEEDVYVGALLTAVELVRNGVTCFADPGGFLMDPVAKAVAESGIRAVLSVGGLDTWSPSQTAVWSLFRLAHSAEAHRRGPSEGRPIGSGREKSGQRLVSSCQAFRQCPLVLVARHETLMSVMITGIVLCSTPTRCLSLPMK